MMARRPKPEASGGGGGDLAAVLVSITEFAAMAGVSAEWVRLRITDGRIPKAARGKVALGPALAGVVAYGEAARQRAAAKVDDATWNRLRAARAEEIEVRVAERKRDLIGMDEAQLMVSMICATVGTELTNLPARITRDMELRRKIETEVDCARNRITAKMESLANGVPED
jgi:hypothetical protein